ncbi:MAG: hypothetical protein IKY22_02485 [Bacteroidales bacterium]|nr:hypothetical protein [Bacteroidales bacterium]
MKNSLIQHIRNVFNALKIEEEYFVYDSLNDILPDWLEKEELTHEFVICCNVGFDKERLQQFIHKEIFKIDNHYYWFEGSGIKPIKSLNDNIVETSPISSIEKLKAQTRLPSWLDNFIFGTLCAEYAPDFQRFEYNLNLQHEDNLKYLGTYFPRSYAETFCIFDNLFCNNVIKKTYEQLTEVNILSVGCGTGGDLIGLLTVINKYFASIKRINIVAVDGNEDALNILSQIVERFEQQFHKEINLTAKQIFFDEIIGVDVKSSFDFIITSKMINEIINNGKGAFNNSYYDFAKVYSPMIKDTGILMILDVTTKVGVSGFCPILLNQQINRFVYEHSDYVSLIPIPCIEKENCQVQCFTQKEFSVSHSKFENDKSRVAYRIIVKKSFYKKIQLKPQNVQYQIQPDRCCGQGTIIADAFFLSNIDDNVTKDECKEPIKTIVNKSEVIENKRTNHVNVLDFLKETLDRLHTKQSKEAYLIDTNAFIYAPNIIDKIAEEYPIFVSAKVVDELDHRKDITSGNDKKKIQKALKSINMAISDGRVQTLTSDARLLPADFDRRSPDNLILSVALKLKRMGYTPILVTSDNGFQIKAKTLEIKTISYTKIKSKI